MDDSMKTYPETPEDIRDETQLTNMVYGWRREAQQHHETYIRNAEEDEKFYEGEQWTEKERKLLEGVAAPCLTKNKIFPLINLVLGVQSQEPLEMRTLGRTEEDAPIAEGMSEVLKWIWDRKNGERELSQVFKKGIVTGRSWLAIEQDFEEDMFEGKTTVTAISGNEILYDPKSVKYNLEDCDYLIREKVISRSTAKNLWPEKEKELVGYFHDFDSKLGSTLTMSTASLRRTIPILEVWYRVYRKTKLLVNMMDGNIHDASDMPEEQLKPIIENNPYLMMIQKTKKKMKFARLCGYAGGVVLEWQDSPYKDDFYPYIPFFAYRGTSDFGIVRNLKDAQKELNKRSSQLLRILNSSINTGIITDDPELADDFERVGNRPGFALVAKQGASWTIVQPPQFPIAHARLEEQAGEDLKRISGINDDLLGFREATQSGIAIDLRRRQGMTIIMGLFDNLRYTMQLATQLVISRFQQFMPEEKIARILGPKRAIPELIQAIQSVDAADFDIIIIQVPSSPSIRLENFAKMEALLKIGIPIPPDIVIEASDIPQKEEIIQRMGLQEDKTLANIPGATPLPVASGPPV